MRSPPRLKTRRGASISRKEAPGEDDRRECRDRKDHEKHRHEPLTACAGAVALPVTAVHQFIAVGMPLDALLGRCLQREVQALGHRAARKVLSNLSRSVQLLDILSERLSGGPHASTA